MDLTLDAFLDELDSHAEAVPLEELTALMTRLCVRREDFGDRVRFRPERYQRNLFREGSAYQALVLCWMPGQASPIHDHRGSACGVRVVEGDLTEVVFKRGADGVPIECGTNRLEAGEVCGSYDADIHEVRNDDDAQGLITLHVYTPPLTVYGIYERGSSEIAELASIPV